MLTFSLFMQHTWWGFTFHTHKNNSLLPVHIKYTLNSCDGWMKIHSVPSHLLLLSCTITPTIRWLCVVLCRLSIQSNGVTQHFSEGHLSAAPLTIWFWDCDKSRSRTLSMQGTRKTTQRGTPHCPLGDGSLISQFAKNTIRLRDQPGVLTVTLLGQTTLRWNGWIAR